MAGRASANHPGNGVLTRDDWEQVVSTFELSQREHEVAEFLFRGFNRDTIALRLRKADRTPLSPETVRVYCDRLFQKLNVSDSTGMVLRILRSLDWFEQALNSRDGAVGKT
ncbi:MAG: hypothetical protein KDA89_10240 [Planctomycetaceae bacterium]|nr:hypothetical protein [Planctomycetaceae bacterium]